MTDRINVVARIRVECKIPSVESAGGAPPICHFSLGAFIQLLTGACFPLDTHLQINGLWLSQIDT